MPSSVHHLQIVWLLSQGRSEREVAGESAATASAGSAMIVRRYNAEGAGGLGDHRAQECRRQAAPGQGGRGGAQDAWPSRPADGGLWTGPKVRGMDERPARPQGLAAAGLGLPEEARAQPAEPRPRHAKAASAEEQAF